MSSDAPLAEFNRAVSHWSNQFAPELRRVAYVIASRMGWDHSEFKISWKSLQRHYEKAHGETTSLNTLKKLARLWADAGGLKIIAGYRETVPARPKGYADRNGQQRGGSRQNADDSTNFHVDFGVVVKSRRVYTGKQGRPVTSYYTEPWSLGQTAPTSEASQARHGEPTIADPSMTPHSPLNDPSLTPYSSFDSSGYSPITLPSSGPDDDGRQPSSKESQNQGPAAPRPAGADEVPGNKPYEFEPRGKERWAGFLGVPLSSIRESFWSWFGHRVNEMFDKSYDGCEHGCSPCRAIVSGACTHPDEDCPCLCPTSGEYECRCPCPVSGKFGDCQCRCEHDGYWDTTVRVGEEVAQDASVKDNPVGYFQTVLMQKVDLALHRAKAAAEAKAAEAERQRHAEEDAADRQRQAEEAKAERERKREEAREAACQCARDELEKILPELAELRHGGDIDAARDDVEIWDDPRQQLEKAQWYIGRARAGIGRAS